MFHFTPHLNQLLLLYAATAIPTAAIFLYSRAPWRLSVMDRTVRPSMASSGHVTRAFLAPRPSGATASPQKQRCRFCQPKSSF